MRETMRCVHYVWILIVFLTLRFGAVTAACTGDAENSTSRDHPAAKNSSACLDIFMTLMNYLSAEARKSSNNCTSVAADKRSCLLSDAHSALASSVRRIQERLLDCDLKDDSGEDFLAYFRCMKDAIDEVRTPLKEIGKNSSQTIDAYLTVVHEKNREERDCLNAVVRKSKQAADQAFMEYRTCLSTATNCVCRCLKSSSTSTTLSSTSPIPPSEEDTSTFDTDEEIFIQPRTSKSSVNFLAAFVGAVVLVVIVLIATYLYRNNERRRPIRLQPLP